MTLPLPDGVTWRRPALTEADADAVFRLVAGHNRAIVGFADYTMPDALEQLTEPGFDPGADAWLVHDRSGALVGFGGCRDEGGDGRVEIEVIAGDDTVAAWLFAAARARADEQARAGGHPAATVELAVYRDDEAQRTRAAALGFEPVTTFHRMRIDHDGGVEVPAGPPSVVVRRGPGDDELRRQAYSVMATAFADHFGWGSPTYEQWQDQIDASPVMDWSQLWVADVDGRAVAMLHAHAGFVPDEGCGYVRHVGVLPEHHGRGLARLLLRTAFADDAARGRRGALIHVDTNNVTPAHDLYRGLGMRPVLVVDVWRRPAPT